MVSRRTILIGSASAAWVTSSSPLAMAETTTDPVGRTASGTVLRDANTLVSKITIPKSMGVEEMRNYSMWIVRQVAISKELAKSGVSYTFTLPWERTSDDNKRLKADPVAGTLAAETLYGTDQLLEKDYDWQAAGLNGRLVHLAGLDNAN